MAHLGGILWGLFYGWQIKLGAEPMRVFDRVSDQIMNRTSQYSAAAGNRKRKKAKMKVYTNTSSAPVPRDGRGIQMQ